MIGSGATCLRGRKVREDKSKKVKEEREGQSPTLPE